MPRTALLILIWLLMFGKSAAQDLPLTTEALELTSRTDLYGQPVLYAEGQLINSSNEAYSAVSLQAIAYDTADNEVGEGLGYLVNACGAALFPDFTIQPGAGQTFVIPLELYEADAQIERVEITADGSLAEPMPPRAPSLLSGITQVSDSEVVNVEWIDSETLRFADGCWRDLFNQWRWSEYNLRTGVQTPLQHPKAALITEALRRQLGLLDDLYLQHSFLRFAPNDRRIVYQTELNTIITAEPDGSFKRVLFETLSDRTLQGINWLEDGRFLAYYYGAFGDPVTYFTASVDGQVFSEAPAETLPSITIPGASFDGDTIIFSTAVDGTTGYYVKPAAFPNAELLFEALLPGNNWPGPIYEEDADGARFIYLALPETLTPDSSPSGSGESVVAKLACFNRQSETLVDLSPLPLQLATDERAWWWPSPDGNMIALAANGVNGGLWLIDLNALPACEPS